MLNDEALNTLFLQARTQNGWLDTPVTDAQLQRIFDLMIMAPTSANCAPARIVFVKSREQADLLASCVMPGNFDKVRTAPVTAIIGMDMEFYEQLPKLFPHADARAWFVGNQPMIDATAFRNSTLQGAYLMLAARAVGLDCGPMSGFDADKVNANFFPDSKVKVNFICSLGHGDASKVFPRSPRFAFEEVCKVV
jgi:nitroreductase